MVSENIKCFELKYRFLIITGAIIRLERELQLNFMFSILQRDNFYV